MEIAMLSLVVGFVAAVPAMGPSSAIIVRRILVGRERTGLAFAAGYIIAEGLACLAAVWGVELIFYTAPAIQPVLQWVGVAMLVGVGVYFAMGGGAGEGVDESEPEEATTFGSQFAFGFGITALNPALVAGWTTAMGVVLSMTGIELAIWQKWFIPFGIVVGETLWFGLLVALARQFDDYLDGRVIGGVIRAIGAGLVLLAIWTGYQTWVGAW